MKKRIFFTLAILLIINLLGCENEIVSNSKDNIHMDDKGTIEDIEIGSENDDVNQEDNILDTGNSETDLDEIGFRSEDEYNPFLTYKNLMNFRQYQVEEGSTEISVSYKSWSNDERVPQIDGRVLVNLKDVKSFSIALVDSSETDIIFISNIAERINENEIRRSSESVGTQRKLPGNYYLLLTTKYENDNRVEWKTTYIKFPKTSETYLYRVFSNSKMTIPYKDTKNNILWDYHMSDTEIKLTDNIYDTVNNTGYSILVKVED